MRVRTDEPERLARALVAQGAAVATEDERSLTVTGLTTLRIGQVAAEAGITVYEATATSSALEAAFMESTAASVEFHAGRA